MGECLWQCPAQRVTHSRRTDLANTDFLRRTSGARIFGATVFIVSGARGHHLQRPLDLCGKVGRKVPQSTESPRLCGKALGRLRVSHLRRLLPSWTSVSWVIRRCWGGWGSRVSQQNWVFQVPPGLLLASGLFGFMVLYFSLN